VNAGGNDDPRQLASVRGSARHRRQGAGLGHGAEVNMALMRRLAEGAATSGDLRSAAEAVRVCMAEAETLYQLAMTEREQALALARQAAEEQARARHLHQEAALAFEAARARRERPALGPAQDAPGSRLRPDPSDVRTPAELIEALRQFRTWAGNPSYRDMARACNGRPAPRRCAECWRQASFRSASRPSTRSSPPAAGMRKTGNGSGLPGGG
jgi:hypothetical protein